MTIKKSTRSKLLAGVGTSVLASMIAGGAYAGQVVVSTGSTVASGHKVILEPVTNSGVIDADVTGVDAGVSVVGTQTGTTNTVTENLINASATATSFANSIDLALIEDDVVNGNFGAASLGLANNTGVATATAAGNTLSLDLTGFASGTAVNNENTIQAITTANKGSTSIAGSLPASGYTSTTEGSSTASFGSGTPHVGIGSAVASSVQINEATGHEADAAGNEISLSLMSDLTNDVDSSPTLDDNTIASQVGVNSAASTIDIQEGGASSFNGSAVVSNLQANSGTASAETAGNSISAQVEGTTGGAINTLDGGLSVQGNTISSSATGNQALGSQNGPGNRILIGDTISVAGPGTTAPATVGSTIDYDGGDMEAEVIADLVIHNNQGNDGGGGSLTASTASSTISAFVRSLDEGSITLADNTVSSQAKGNVASGALLSGEDAASFDATVALASQQTNNNYDVISSNLGSQIVAVTSGASGAGGGVTNESTISVAGNSASAVAYGNDSAQTVDLAANTLNAVGSLANATGGTTGANDDGNIAVEGAVTIANLQSNYNSDVSAAVAGTVIGLDADTQAGFPNLISANSLSTESNVQEAIALGSNTANALSLAGNTVGGGAAIASVQIGEDNATVSSTLESASVGLIASSHVADSTLSVSGNTQRALGYGASGSNALSVDGNTVAVAAGGAGIVAGSLSGADIPYHDGTTQPSVTASFGVLSDQSVQNDVTASASGAEIGLSVEGYVADSGVANDGNALVAAARGVDVSNAVTVDAGTIDSAGSIASVAKLGNFQAVAGTDTDVAATASGGVVTDVEDDVQNSTVSTSSNVARALATGTGSTNTLVASGNTIDTTDTGGYAPGHTYVPGSVLTEQSSFGLTNAQYGEGTVSASLLNDPVTPTASSSVLTRLGTAIAVIEDSTVTSDGNQLAAEATSNSTTNLVSLSGNEATTSSGLQNFQTTGADVSAAIGTEGTAGSPGGPFNYTVTGSADLAHDSGTNILTAGTLYIDTTGLSPAAIQTLVGDGWSITGANEVSRAASGYSATAVDYAALLPAGPGLALNDVAPPVPATPNAGGVTIVAEGASIVGSTLSVDANRATGAVTGNSASNALTVDAGTIASSSGLDNSSAVNSGGVLSTTADHSLQNTQFVASGELESEVFSSFGIDTAEDVAISASTLSVSDNAQRSTAVANTAGNALTLDGNAISAGSVLQSSQSGDAAVSASSAMDVFAPAAVGTSTVDISSNTNTALGVLNDVTNTLTVSGTNVAALDSTLGAGESGNASLVAVAQFATADHVLQNLQSADTSATSTATTSLYNDDEGAIATSGLTDSTFTMNGNSTYSEASANRASNTLALDAASSLDASAGLSNMQSSSATVSSSATTLARLTLAADGTGPTAAVENSTVEMEGNSTQALARGNSATNTLSAVAGAGYATSTGTAQVDFPTGAVAATYGVLNAQDNSGGVTATSQNATYVVALNAVATDPGVGNSTVSVGGNSVIANAYGNSATNSISLVGLSTGSPTAAIGSSQVNSGAITASVVGAQVGITSTGLAGGSSFGVGGNTISASAVGNSVSNAVTRVSH